MNPSNQPRVSSHEGLAAGNAPAESAGLLIQRAGPVVRTIAPLSFMVILFLVSFLPGFLIGL